jgi:glycosidase
LRRLVDAAHARGLYVIFDVVLNHVGNAFGYAPGPSARENAEHTSSDHPLPIHWRDANGVGAPAANAFPPPPRSRDALVWPEQFQDNELFRRRGLSSANEQVGDFFSLKELVTEPLPGRGTPVTDFMIRCHQYLMARYDVDGFRIDTLKHIDPASARTFGNAVREFALSIGKANFFTFGEIADGDEDKIARFIGRDTQDRGDAVGVDATLDFPLAHALPFLVKDAANGDGRRFSPKDVADIHVRRKRAQKHTITSHGEASQYFVTFLDNHDGRDRRFAPDDPALAAAQTPLGVGAMFCLQGIPCLYYGTEQGLTGLGPGTGDSGVREPLWAKPGGAAFDRTSPAYRAVRALADVRAAEPALRYGRQYFRPISGDGQTFGVSTFAGGVLAVSRVLNDQEVVVVANPQRPSSGVGPLALFVVVDAILNRDARPYAVRFSNQTGPAAPGAVREVAGPNVRVIEADGSVSTGGPLRALPVTLRPMEFQVLLRPLA